MFRRRAKYARQQLQQPRQAGGYSRLCTLLVLLALGCIAQRRHYEDVIVGKSLDLLLCLHTSAQAGERWSVAAAPDDRGLAEEGV